MTRGTVVGLRPWLPACLARSRWWTRPVRAERLAALRVGVGAVLLLDVLGTYLPRHADFFGRGSLSAPGLAADGTAVLEAHRSLLVPIESPDAWRLLLLTWAAAAVCLMLGVFPRVAAAVAWFFAVSVLTVNPALHNGGDQVRNALLFLLILCPSGAAWAVGAARRDPADGPVRVYPWPIRLLTLQLVMIYFMNGVFKLGGDVWRDGSALTCLLGDGGWTRWSFAGWPVPDWGLRGMTWAVLAWEVLFPVLMLMPALRRPALLFGVLFHLGTGVTMRIGVFPLYMLCLYLPFLPWERLSLPKLWGGIPGTIPAAPGIASRGLGE